MNISHIINPVSVDESSDLYIAQPITFETMRRAKNHAEKSGITVGLFYTCYNEDLDAVPDGFTSVPNLEKSVLDVTEFRHTRKLPLIKDILDRLYDASDADYFIYTNVDIALCENFYIEVAKKIDEGFDAFVINRRTLLKNYKSVDELPQMYLDKGELHPGYDCFVFKRSVYPKYILGDVCIGANWVGRALIGNLIVNAEKFKVFKDDHLTFHIGDDRNWKVDRYSDYDLHNQNEIMSILQEFDDAGQLVGSDLLARFKKQFNDMGKSARIRKTNPFFEFIHKKNKSINQSPVFVIGFPRSGTTLLQSLIATQNIFTFPETHYFNIVLNSIKVDDELVIDNYKNIISTIEERYPLTNDAKDYVWLRLKNKNLFVKVLFEIIVLDGLIKQGVSQDNLSKIYWLEKTPSHAFKLGLIATYYPKAKYIYILRDPLHAFSSWRRVSQGWGHESQPVEEYAKLWLNLLNSAEKFNKNAPGKMKFVRLEDLVNDKSLVMGDIMAFIGRKFEPSELDSRTNGANSYILPNEKWKLEGALKEITKDNLTPKEDLMTLFEKIKSEFLLRAQMKKYGYEFKYWNHESLGMCNESKGICEEIDGILERLGKVSNVKFIRNPIKKYKLYKKLINEYSKYHEKKC